MENKASERTSLEAIMMGLRNTSSKTFNETGTFRQGFYDELNEQSNFWV